MRFTWDPTKNEINIAGHGIDFADAVRVFNDAYLYTSRSDRRGEERYTAVGRIDDLMIAVAYTDRQVGDTWMRRIISARRARRNERKTYDERARG